MDNYLHPKLSAGNTFPEFDVGLATTHIQLLYGYVEEAPDAELILFHVIKHR